MNGYKWRGGGLAVVVASLWGLASTPAGCSSGSESASGVTSSVSGDASCAQGHALTGASYDITKSRFAFGAKPVAVDAGPLVRWTGSDGVVAIWTDGSEMASMNAGAPEANLPDWSRDGNALAAHVTAYFVSMGVATCQIAGTDGTYSGGGGGSVDGGVTFQAATQTNVGLVRSIDGVPVVNSIAFARFDTSDQTTFETFYWPTIPADVVTAARAFHDKLAAPGALAAYKAKLPADAQSDGQVVIHHRVGGSSLPFTAVATYDTVQITPQNDGGELSFDPQGNPVMDNWEAF
jgi:plastocyanin